ncbi:hypothetical protein [Actinoplanes sp. NBRC 103695]|uniref:hypothetical protein n=1 Tax=Actinoplanes sp. NBRC 103695 TaxID=3032202 RepID=UPI0024A05618|nr:hypothetical protein [Actinoplanes sp. NBRC 103695]GLY95247.1 hypothetical protein Acsp02_25020 [Actinoplanes sp. NBRC 103695]
MAFVKKIRTAIVHRAIERREHRLLSTELAAFQSPAERAELDELIARHSAEETRLIRAILDQQDYERHRTAGGVGGHRAA